MPTSVDALLKRAARLDETRGDAQAEAAWDMMCAGAKDELLQMLESKLGDELTEDEISPDMDGMIAEFDVFLEQEAEACKQAFIQQKRRGKQR